MENNKQMFTVASRDVSLDGSGGINNPGLKPNQN
jgi:hypothetical protein